MTEERALRFPKNFATSDGWMREEIFNEEWPKRKRAGSTR